MSSGKPPDLGIVLRRLRRVAGLTQAELAERAGTTWRGFSTSWTFIPGPRSRLGRLTSA